MAEPEAPLEAAPTADLDLIAKYAPLPDPVLPPAPPPPAPVAEAPSEQAPIEHDWLTKPLEEVSEPPEEPLALARTSGGAPVADLARPAVASTSPSWSSRTSRSSPTNRSAAEPPARSSSRRPPSSTSSSISIARRA